MQKKYAQTKTRVIHGIHIPQRGVVCVTHLQHSRKSLTLIKHIVQYPNGSSDIVQESDRNRHSLRVQIIRRLVATVS